MELVFLNNYAELNDKEIVNKIINKPYNEELQHTLFIIAMTRFCTSCIGKSTIKTRLGMRIVLEIYLDS